jgi:hypothetical protein
MPKFKSIVLTTDLSENSDAVAPYALELAAKYGGTIHSLIRFCSRENRPNQSMSSADHQAQ